MLLLSKILGNSHHSLQKQQMSLTTEDLHDKWVRGGSKYGIIRQDKQRPGGMHKFRYTTVDGSIVLVDYVTKKHRMQKK